MPIKRVSISGFRSLRDVTWEPGRLNVLIGPNNAGKSNLLRALALLQRSAAGEIADAVLQEGGMAPLLWDGQATELRWAIEGVGFGVADNPLTYELMLRRLGVSSGFRVEHELLADYTRFRKGEKSQPFKYLERDPRHAVTWDQEERRLLAHDGSVPDDQTLLSLLGGPFGLPVVLGLRRNLASWRIYHALRVDAESPLRQAAVARVEQRLAADGGNLIPVLHSLYSGQREFKHTLDAAMRAAFGEEFEELVFPPAADQRVQLRVRWASLKIEQSAQDLSDGTMRFLALIAILANPNPGALVAIDEPETGLHPRMFRVVADLAAEAAERTQVVFTTHSPQLLDALAEQQPTTTVAQLQDGATRLDQLNSEELQRWVREFSLGDLFTSGELELIA